MARSKRALRGIYAAATALAIFVVAVGSCIALILLVISMEEGGASLSDQSLSVTQAVVLLSQGNGFSAGALKLTIIPLGLTLVLVSLLVTCVRRFGMSWEGFASGGLLWLIVSFLFQQIQGFILVDTTFIIACRSALVYCLAYAIAGVRSGKFSKWLASSPYGSLPSGLRLAITQGVHVAVWLIAIFVLMGALTVVVWIALYHDAVGKLFVLSEMGTSSRILTSLAAIVWLPNLIIWALSWLTGGGFYIGELASFTLWTGQGEALPPIPIFGLFPEAVTSSVQRIILLVLPTIVTGIVALLTLLTKRGFDMLASLRKQGLRQIDTRLVTTFLYSCISLVITGLIVLLALGLAFFCSNGDLGEHRLKGVGVHVTESAAVFARDISVGLLAPWLMLLLVSALVLLWNSTIDSLHRSVTLVSAVPASLNSYESSDKSQTRISGTDTSSQPSHTVQTVNKTSHSDAPGQSSGQ